jgi:hypothetical protein
MFLVIKRVIQPLVMSTRRGDGRRGKESKALNRADHFLHTGGRGQGRRSSRLSSPSSFISFPLLPPSLDLHLQSLVRPAAATRPSPRTRALAASVTRRAPGPSPAGRSGWQQRLVQRRQRRRRTRTGMPPAGSESKKSGIAPPLCMRRSIDKARPHSTRPSLTACAAAVCGGGGGGS